MDSRRSETPVKEDVKQEPGFSEKEVSISPERSKHFRKMLTSFREKQGASTRKAWVSDPLSPAVGVQKSVFVFLCSLSVR